MFVDSEPKIEGVAAFIVLPRHRLVLTIEELQTKESTNKIAGMRSIPMETVESGETYEEAMRRLLIEEVSAEPLTSHRITEIELCAFQMVPNIWVHAFYLEASYLTQICLGSAAKEVANPRWEYIDEVLNHELGSRKYRGGNRESALSFHNWRRFKCPDIYESIIDRVSSSVFEEIKADQSKSQFQPFPQQLPGIVPLPLIRS